MTRQIVSNELSFDEVFVSSRLIRAQRREQALRMQRTLALLFGFAAIGLGPYAIGVFKVTHMPAHSHAAIYSSSIDTTASATDSRLAGAQTCIAAAQAAIGQTMTRFHSEQDALDARLGDPQAGGALFAGAPKFEPDLSALSRFILLDPLAMPFPGMTGCVTTVKEPVS